MDPLYGDLHAILSATECHQRGINVFVTNPCDALGRVHVYGSIWFKLNILGINQSDLFVLGTAIDILFMTITVALINPRSVFQVIITAAVLFSPAATLALERANNDLFVFILTTISALLIIQRDRVAKACSLCLIGLSSALKIYPSILFGTVLFAMRWQIKEIILIVGVSSLCVAAWMITSLDEILLLKDLVPKPLDQYTTGAKALFIYLGRPYPQILLIPEVGRLAIFVGLVAAGALLLARRLNFSPIQSSKLNIEFLFFIFGLSILFFTYTINSNYDYRWIFFILLIPHLFRIQHIAVKDSRTRRLVALSFMCALVVMWTEAFRAGRFFGVLNFNSYFNIGRSTFSIELIQQFLKELSAWILFTIVFAFVIKQFFKR